MLEEVGTIELNANTINQTPDLDFLTAGGRRFDTDCDGTSNLAEYYAGTDPSFAENNNSMVCEGNFEPDNFELS